LSAVLFLLASGCGPGEGELDSELQLGAGLRDASDLSGFIVNVDGQDVLNVKPGVDFVGLCSYSASVKVGTRFLGEISLFGTGVSDQTDLQQNIEVNQGSNFFKLRPGDTVPALQDLCLKFFRDEVRDSVVEDLKSLVKLAVTYDGPTQSDLKRALEAALFGPKAWDLGLHGHVWNVEPAVTRSENGAFVVEGTLERTLPWYLLKWPFKATYAFTFEGGKLKASKVSVPDQEGWEGAAHQLARTIADEAYMEYGNVVTGGGS
jgi:hypothetical protein